jgi:pimeloyl-ACP methyl ester carboxylesterase
LHPSLHERFDLIGMDPRGISRSTPVKCDPAAFNRPVSLFPHTPAQFDQVTAWAGAFGASCLRLTGPLLAHVDTGSVARDMERLRRALGDEKLNFLGLSYGAHLGSTYAEL